MPVVSLMMATTFTLVTPTAAKDLFSIPTTSSPTTPGQLKLFVQLKGKVGLGAKKRAHLTRRPTSSPCWVIGKENVKPRLNFWDRGRFCTVRKSRMHSARK